MAIADGQFRGTGLMVPALELAQIGSVGIGHRRHEIVAGHRLTIVALEIKIHAAPETVPAKQGLDHPNHLGTLVVDGDGVEVVDLDVGIRSHRMRHRSGVLRELAGAQHPHIFDALDPARAEIGRKLLIAEHGQPFLEAELEPVAAGDPITGPVVEVFVTDDAKDALIVGVGGDFWLGQHIFGVEDVEALVLHRPHVEIADRHDLIQIQIVFQPEALLVPSHGGLERIHRMLALIEIVRLDVDTQPYLAPGTSDEGVFEMAEMASNQGKQITGLGKGIVPSSPVPAIV